MVSSGDTSYGLHNNSSSSSSSSGSSSDDSTFTHADSKDDAAPEPYSGPDFHPNSTGTVDTGQALPDPPPPLHTGSDNGGDVSVDTTVLKQFADNLDTIVDGVNKAFHRTRNMAPIRPGLFTEAVELQSKISGGESGGGGLQQNLEFSLDSLQTALMHTADRIRTLANKYSTLEEVNNKEGAELHSLMQTAHEDLQAFQQNSSAASQSLQSDISAAGATGSTSTTET